MKQLMIIPFFFLLGTSVIYGQDTTYNLSPETQREYREMMKEAKEFESISKTLLLIGAFSNLLGEEIVTTTIKISQSDWNLYKSGIDGLSSLTHQVLAKRCGFNALSKQISKNKDDTKFWEKLYEFHLQMQD